MIGLPALGCVPSQRTIKGGLLRNCSDSENQATMLFNTKLSSQIDALSKKFPEARLVYLDIYNPLLKMIQNPAKYGNKTHVSLPSYNFKTFSLFCIYISISLIHCLWFYDGLLGFEVANKGCCGTGNFEAGILCNSLTPHICSNTKNYIFWDSFHPTQEAYNVLCSLVLDNKIKNFF